MERVLHGLEPKEVLTYFEDLSRIPRGSGNEKNATDYLISFAEAHGLEWHRDQSYNVLIRKKASRGMEDRPGVILQGHTDMVCEKNKDTVHDFENDPIQLLVEGDKITAKGTTLGADDGIGIALALALMADEDAIHPELELLCTSDEERGMTGAESFDTSMLKGRILVNLDADDDGVFVVGCAGGPAVRTEIPLLREELEDDWIPAKIKITGLKGGHSGEDIHRGRANSIKLLTRILLAMGREGQLKIAHLEAGLKYNAIPREAEAWVYVPNDQKELHRVLVKRMEGLMQNEYQTSDPGVQVILDMDLNKENAGKLEEADYKLPLKKESAKNLLNYLHLAENGIIRMNMDFKDTVESSVGLGMLRMEGDKAVMETLTRSSLESIYMDTYYKIQSLAEMAGGKTILMSNCPEWEYNPNSHIKAVFEETYRNLYGKAPEIWILHAGLECGVFSKKMSEPLDMIAAGPDVRDLHTPGEYVSISSIQRFWEFFQEVMKNI